MTSYYSSINNISFDRYLKGIINELIEKNSEIAFRLHNYYNMQSTNIKFFSIFSTHEVIK